LSTSLPPFFLALFASRLRFCAIYPTRLCFLCQRGTKARAEEGTAVQEGRRNGKDALLDLLLGSELSRVSALSLAAVAGTGVETGIAAAAIGASATIPEGREERKKKKKR